jgi:hypothetical protein
MPTYVLMGIPKWYDKHFIIIYELFIVAPYPSMIARFPCHLIHLSRQTFKMLNEIIYHHFLVQHYHLLVIWKTNSWLIFLQIINIYMYRTFNVLILGSHFWTLRKIITSLILPPWTIQNILQGRKWCLVPSLGHVNLVWA